MKVVKIVLALLGALGVGLVGLILACHFNPGLSDSIAAFLYKDTVNSAENSAKSQDTTVPNQSSDENEDAGLSGENLTEFVATAASDAISDIQGTSGEPSEEEPMTPEELKTLEDYGLTQADVLNNLQEYFDSCYEHLAEGKGEDISFYNVVRDSMLAQEVINSYDNESYRAGFMDKFMDDYKVDTCGWNVDEEELQAGYYLVTHSFVR